MVGGDSWQPGLEDGGVGKTKKNYSPTWPLVGIPK